MRKIITFSETSWREVTKLALKASTTGILFWMLTRSLKPRVPGKWIESRLGQPISSYCYPFYYIKPLIKDAVIAAGYNQARGDPASSYYTVPDDGSLDRFNADCRHIATRENVGGWIRPNCWHVLTYHGIGDEHDAWEPITVAEFTRQIEELAKHRDSGAVEVVSFSDGADRFRIAQ